MAWTTPLTAVANAALSAAQWNASVRDNLLMTAPALAGAAGQIFVATGANAIAARTPATAEVTATETTASTSYTDLTTSGPAVTSTTGTQALVFCSLQFHNQTAGAQVLAAFAVSGATTVGASDNDAVRHLSSNVNEPERQGVAKLVTGLTAGSNTFTMKYRVTAGTGTFTARTIVVVPL